MVFSVLIILLFINDLDEQMTMFLNAFAPGWVEKRVEEIKRNLRNEEGTLVFNHSENKNNSTIEDISEKFDTDSPNHDESTLKTSSFDEDNNSIGVIDMK